MNTKQSTQHGMITIPATPAGIAELEQAIHAGASVNLTQVFGPDQIRAARAAHRRGLARRLHDKLPVQDIASVVSIDVGAIDEAVNAMLERPAAALRDRAGAAIVRLALHAAEQDSSFAVFAAFGATPQRLRWTGAAAAQLETAMDIDGARAVLTQLAHHGVDLDSVAAQLLAARLGEWALATDQLPALAA